MPSTKTSTFGGGDPSSACCVPTTHTTSVAFVHDLLVGKLYTLGIQLSSLG